MNVNLFRKVFNEASYETKELLIEAYPAAYSQMLTDNRLFYFGERFEIDTNFGDTPLVIANGFAPRGQERRCLVVNDEYKLEVFENKGKTMLRFIKK